MLRHKFEIKLHIKELTNLPHTSGQAFIKWFIKDSPKPDARGRTPHGDVTDHKVTWDYNALTTGRMGTDKHDVLRPSHIVFDVMWDSPTSGRISVGRSELNLSEYVGHDGSIHAYLLKDSKVNCILHIGLTLKLIKGPSNFTVPPFTAPQIISDLAGVIDEERKNDDVFSDGLVGRLHNTFSVDWDPRPWYLSPQACVEDIFRGGDGFSKDYWQKAAQAADEEPAAKSFVLDEAKERENLQSWNLDMG